ncbi:MAG: SpoIIE family protein phosphatase [Bacteroidia bacterium]|nr:SpoIIE family protein phosphatase [Bacteroidia bacterium]
MLEKQNNVISEKNKDITDSINYAKKIQDAMLPDDKVFSAVFPENFVLFLPRDIVSGDFYWVAEKGSLKFIAVADCTGHGVPGSLMSMIGNGLLNQLILEKNITDPTEILGRMRAEIIRTLKQNESGEGTKDGMDIALCVIEKTGEIFNVKFSGANNPIFLISKGQLQEVKGNNFPVGISVGELKYFSETTCTLEKGDLLYLFTDGFADQFGGDKGKKFKYKNLRETIVANYSLEPNQQKENLKKVFDNWKGNLDQVDDVTIVGIKL